MNPIPSFQSCCDGCRFDHAPLLDAQSVSKQMLKNPNVLRTYLERGGNPDAVVYKAEGEDLLTLAIHHAKPDLIALLIQYKAKIPRDILDIVFYDKSFELLAEAGGDIGSHSIDHYARICEGTNVQFIQRLAEKGADINYRIANLTTIIYLTANHKPKPLKAMIDAGADIYIIEPDDSETVLDWALTGRITECAIPLILHNAPFHPKHTNKIAEIAKTFHAPLHYRELHGHFPPHMRRPIGNPFPINPFIQNCEEL